MIEKIDYKTYKINGKIINFPYRVWKLKYFDKHEKIIVDIWPKKTDSEYGIEYKFPPFKNIKCYDLQGILKWEYIKGIVGMAKEDEKTVKLFDGEYLHFVDVETGIENKDRMQFLK